MELQREKEEYQRIDEAGQVVDADVKREEPDRDEMYI